MGVVKEGKSKIFTFLSVPRSGHSGIMLWFCLNSPAIVRYFSANQGVKDKQLNSIDFKPRKAITKQVYNNDSSYKDEKLVLNIEIMKYEEIPILETKKFMEDKYVHPIVAIRTYRNHLASTINTKQIGNGWIEKYKPYWIDHFNRMKNNECEVIIYDLWHTNKEYRDLICERYSLLKNDNGRNKLGSPSSYDEFKHQGKASDLDSLNRWKKNKDNSVYKKHYTEQIQLMDEQLLRYIDNWSPEVGLLFQ